MNSSGIKRGLAGSAITALAITGLPFLASSANAVPLVDQADGADSITLVTPDTETASVQNDGDDNSVNLVANGGENVDQVRFEYRTAVAGAEPGQWKTIATVGRTEGAFLAEWDPTTNLFNTAVEVRAVALDSEGDEITTPAPIADPPADDLLAADSQVTTVSPGAESIDIAYAPGAEVGVFQQDYTADDATQGGLLGPVSGTTSDVSENPDLTFDAPFTDGRETMEDVVEDTNGTENSRSYSAPVDFSGYDFSSTDAEGADEALIRATADGDDAEPVVLFEQTIANVTAGATESTVTEGDNGEAVVTVTDADGNPIVGAQVVREGEGFSEANAEYTNSQGQAFFDIAGDEIDADGETFSFYVNVDDDDDYQAAKDFRRTVTISNEAQNLESISADSNDGAAFDFDENEAGDITVTATDQNGEPISGQTISYTWTVAPFDAEVKDVTTDADTVTTGEDGTANVPLPEAEISGTYTLNYYVNQDGTPGQGEGDLSGDPLVVKAGEAELEFADQPAAAAGTTATFEATLELEDGTPLVGRDVAFDLTRNGDDVVLAAQADQPAGTTRTSQTDAEDTTDADGAVQVAVTDPANTPARSEQDATLSADTVLTEGIGNARTAEATTDVEFITDQGPAGTEVVIDEQEGEGKPGVAEAGSVTVTSNDPENDNDADAPVEGLLVTLTVDGDAFFTDSSADVDNEDGDLEGENLPNLGQKITVVTGADGTADYEIAVKGSDEFNDDGEAEFNVTATASGDTDTEEYVFSSEDPLNGGEVLIKLASNKFQDSSVLPQLPTTDDAAYDVMVTDQFGNPVGGADVDIDINGVGTLIDGDESDDSATAEIVTTDFDDNVEFYISSNQAGDSTPVGSWDADSSVFDKDTNDFEDSVEDDIEGEGPTVTFYDVDYANSTFTLAQGGAEKQPVGSTVIMTYTATDQNGEPIELFVDFFRTGPDNQQGGEANSKNVFTGEDGKATYVFAGTAEGTATVTAIASETENGESIPETQATDTVSFGKDEQGPKTIVEAIISADSNGPQKDVVRFQVDDAAEGATVKLFKIRGKVKDGNRRLKQVREDIVPEGGTLTFKVADRNGNQKTRFIAKVSETDISQKAKSNTQKPR